MFKCGFSAAGFQQRRSLLPGAERPKQEHAWNNVKRAATTVQATKAVMFRTNELQPYSNHTSGNQSPARPKDNQSKSSMKLKLSSVIPAGQGKTNDASRRGTRTRPADARPECSTSAINDQRSGRGKAGKGFRRDEAFPSRENKSRKGRMHTDRIRKGRPSKTTKRRESLVQQHPLAKAFTDSLDHTTAHLSEFLPRALSDKLETLLCRTAATTSLSETYLSHSSSLKTTLFSSSPLLSGPLEKKADELKGLTHEGLEKLDVLWEKWKQCVGEIQRLATDEATFAEGREAKHYGNGKGDGNESGMVNGEDWGEPEYAALAERIKSVGDVWIEKMDECEKKIADEELRQRRLAATVLL